MDHLAWVVSIIFNTGILIFDVLVLPQTEGVVSYMVLTIIILGIVSHMNIMLSIITHERFNERIDFDIIRSKTYFFYFIRIIVIFFLIVADYLNVFNQKVGIYIISQESLVLITVITYNIVSCCNYYYSLWINIDIYSYNLHPEELINTCSICTLDFREHDTIARIQRCSHTFHKACLQSWLTQNSCPNCRATIRN